MKTNRTVKVITFFIAALFIFSSCYTKRKGIVPCPHGYNDVKIEKAESIPVRPA